MYGAMNQTSPAIQVALIIVQILEFNLLWFVYFAKTMSLCNLCTIKQNNLCDRLHSPFWKEILMELFKKKMIDDISNFHSII